MRGPVENTATTRDVAQSEAENATVDDSRRNAAYHTKCLACGFPTLIIELSGCGRSDCPFPVAP